MGPNPLFFARSPGRARRQTRDVARLPRRPNRPDRLDGTQKDQLPGTPDGTLAGQDSRLLRIRLVQYNVLE